MDNNSGLLHNALALLRRGFGACQSLFLLLIRLYWGWLLAVSGWGKLTHIDKVVEFFGSLNLPAPSLFARTVSTLELVGGALLMLGLFSRPIALILTGNMIGAYVTADSEAWHSFFTEDSAKFFAADPFPYLLVSILVLLFGPGKIALDEVIARVIERRHAAAKS
jgi:putative oxidoreductase